MNEVQHVIIGAGISGLHLGQLLKQKNITSTIIEKSPGVGGRVATRRIDELGLDHGAPFFEDAPQIREFLKTYKVDHLIKKDGEDLYLQGGMNQLGKSMAQGLEIHRNVRASFLKYQDEKWTIMTDEGPIFSSKTIILTAPLPQAMELLFNSGIPLTHDQELKSIQYDKGIIGLFITQELSSSLKKIHPDGHKFLSMKERSLHPQGQVFLANASFSEEYFGQSDFEILPILLKLAEETCGNSLYVSSYQIKRWRYVKPRSALTFPYLEVVPGLFLTGDSFLFPDIRGSFLSAEALAKIL